MKKLVSKKGSQEIYVTQGQGVVLIRAFDKRKGMSNSVSIFDELLTGLIAQLAGIAATQRSSPRKEPVK